MNLAVGYYPSSSDVAPTSLVACMRRSNRVWLSIVRADRSIGFWQQLGPCLFRLRLPSITGVKSSAETLAADVPNSALGSSSWRRQCQLQSWLHKQESKTRCPCKACRYGKNASYSSTTAASVIGIRSSSTRPLRGNFSSLMSNRRFASTTTRQYSWR